MIGYNNFKEKQQTKIVILEICNIIGIDKNQNYKDHIINYKLKYKIMIEIVHNI